jgi:hypothetical protein
MQYKSVFHSFKVKRKFSMKNGTNLQKSELLAIFIGKFEQVYEIAYISLKN